METLHFISNGEDPIPIILRVVLKLRFFNAFYARLDISISRIKYGSMGQGRRHSLNFFFFHS
jgi:hypothetical protein